MRTKTRGQGTRAAAILYLMEDCEFPPDVEELATELLTQQVVFSRREPVASAESVRKAEQNIDAIERALAAFGWKVGCAKTLTQAWLSEKPERAPAERPDDLQDGGRLQAIEPPADGKAVFSVRELDETNDKHLWKGIFSATDLHETNDKHLWREDAVKP